MLFEISFAHWLVILSVTIIGAGSTKYLWDTLKGKTKPNRVSWSIWALAALIGTGAALTAHADVWATVRIFMAGFVPLLIFLASFLNKQSYWKLTHLDFICGLCSIVALVAWLMAQATDAAILFAILGDCFAALPTIRKAWNYPETESGIIFVTSLVSALLVIPSIPKWDITNSAFQIYLLTVNAVLTFAVYRKHFLK